MKYSIEKIYKDFGQFEIIVTLSFFPESPSFMEYPDLMTGTFYYTPKERAAMEKNILGDSSTEGFVKLKEVLNEVSSEQKKNLIKNGINCSEISSIFFSSQFNPVNEFKVQETRKLPDPNIIEIEIDDDFNHDSFLLNFNKRRIANGYKLTPEETAENIGTIMNFENKSIDDFDEKDEKLKIPIKKHFLRSRVRQKTTTEKEIEELKEIESKEIVHKNSMIRNEIKRAGIGKKNFEKIKPQIEQITPFLLEFNEKRLTHWKFPIWLNYERFLHIFFEHVNEVNLGGNYKNKTKFQYLIDDIFRLIEIVIDLTADEIKDHFAEKSAKNFKRHGEMAIYYNGDYYVIDINPDGLLMTFYKRK